MSVISWEQCRFRESDGSLELPNVHDNFVYALAVHLEDRSLILHTQYRDGTGPHELTDVRFAGVVAHHFDDIVSPSILLDIERDTAEEVVQQWKHLIESRKNYGWPLVDFADLADLLIRLNEQRVVGYRVLGSCGLDGFVLARNAEYRSRDRGVEFA